MRSLFFLAITSSSALAAGQTGTQVLKFSQPAENWEKQSMPVGNGMIGANLFGGVDEPSMQFTVDSVWTGSENPSGTYNAEDRKVKITAKK
ncbi:MAG: glycoside hydrolase N-terminal domain-containing protein [Rubritalea sp.]|uniref:glycoside hydrolase N-terminal domain-containing protein n=1 Tax=Rubritalea sp. TaxID=2109375 RepID=UPI003241CC5F